MATKALTGLVPEWYTPSDQENDELPTRYKVKPLDGIQFMEVIEHGEHNDRGEFRPNHRGRLMLLRAGLKDWENVSDPSEGDQPFAFNLARIKFIPMAHLAELAQRILEISALGAEAVKN